MYFCNYEIYTSISHRVEKRWKFIMICWRLNKLQNVLITRSVIRSEGRGGWTASLVCIACGISPIKWEKNRKENYNKIIIEWIKKGDS